MKKYKIIYADPPWSFAGDIRSSKKDENGKYFRYTPDTTVGGGGVMEHRVTSGLRNLASKSWLTMIAFYFSGFVKRSYH